MPKKSKPVRKFAVTVVFHDETGMETSMMAENVRKLRKDILQAYGRKNIWTMDVREIGDIGKDDIAKLDKAVKRNSKANDNMLAHCNASERREYEDDIMQDARRLGAFRKALVSKQWNVADLVVGMMDTAVRDVIPCSILDKLDNLTGEFS